MFLEKQDLWNEKREFEIIEQAKEDVIIAIKQAESESKTKVSNLIENMYEELPFNLREQLKQAREKENG